MHGLEAAAAGTVVTGRFRKVCPAPRFASIAVSRGCERAAVTLELYAVG